MNYLHLRERLHVYAQLSRLDKPIGTLLLLWPTLWALWFAAAGIPDWHLLVIFSLGTLLTRSAGCVINDYADRDFDGAVARTRQRPFARGAVTPREALLLAAGVAFLALLLILPLNGLTLLLSIPAVLIAVSYPYTKRFFPLPQAYLGLAFSFGIPMAYAATTGTVPSIAWWMLLANLFWTIAYDTCYAMTDRPDDLKIGIHTSAITFGRFDVTAVMLCHGLFLALMMAIGIALQRHALYYLGLMVAAGLMLQQYRQIRGRDRDACFRAFLANNRVGAAVLAGVVFDYGFRHT